MADAQQIIVADGAADRPVLYYHTNHKSCFTTPVVGFKECLGGPAPVLTQHGQSSAGTGAAGASPARLPGHRGTRSLPVTQTGGYLKGFCRQKTTPELDEHGEFPTASPAARSPPCTPAPSPSPRERQPAPHAPRARGPALPGDFTGLEAAQAPESCCFGPPAASRQGMISPVSLNTPPWL